ncbi:LysE family translocator [Paludibacterium paludis]|uniref:Lysine transporter LysE n=1 Tax=Paludibacterium paludis TaxID=1225769 RepID=A0A918UBU0_9NEIS|nr:LysE family translocator [Paludibacterium paludis]GGY24836.1 lysine transporter LysE [Paludibacterium paludis]
MDSLVSWSPAMLSVPYWKFLSIAVVAVLSPGPAVMLALHNGSTHGVSAALRSSLGNISGLLVLALLSLAGASLVLREFPPVFWVVKLIGAGYLVLLGARQWSAVRKGTPAASAPRRRGASGRFYREGMLLALTNPKAILFLGALLPQFLNARAPLFLQSLWLVGGFMTCSFMALMGYATMAWLTRHRMGESERARKLAVLLRAVSGTVLIALALSMLTLEV